MAGNNLTCPAAAPYHETVTTQSQSDDDTARVTAACNARGLRCFKCRRTALIILHQIGLAAALDFVARQWPHKAR